MGPPTLPGLPWGRVCPLRPPDVGHLLDGHVRQRAGGGPGLVREVPVGLQDRQRVGEQAVHGVERGLVPGLRHGGLQLAAQPGDLAQRLRGVLDGHVGHVPRRPQHGQGGRGAVELDGPVVHGGPLHWARQPREGPHDAALLQQLDVRRPDPVLTGVLVVLGAQEARQRDAAKPPLVHTPVQAAGMDEQPRLAEADQRPCTPAQRVGEVAVEVRGERRPRLVDHRAAGAAEEVLREHLQLPPALQLDLHEAQQQAVRGDGREVYLVRAPLAAAEADLVLDVARDDVKQRGHLRLELGGDVGDGVPAALVVGVRHDLHDLGEEEAHLRDVHDEAHRHQHHAVVAARLVPLDDDVADAPHDVDHALAEELAAREQHEVGHHRQRALHGDVRPGVAHGADEDPPVPRGLGHAAHVAEVVAQRPADGVEAGGLLHEGEVAVEGDRHADDARGEVLRGAGLRDEGGVALRGQVADEHEAVQPVRRDRRHHGLEVVLEAQGRRVVELAEHVLAAQVAVLVHHAPVHDDRVPLDEALEAAQVAQDLARARLLRQVVEEPRHHVVESGRLVACEHNAHAQRPRLLRLRRGGPTGRWLAVLGEGQDLHGAVLLHGQGEGLGELRRRAAGLRRGLLHLRPQRQPQEPGQAGLVRPPPPLQGAQVLLDADVPQHQRVRADLQGRRKRRHRLDHLLQLVHGHVLGQEREGALVLRAHLPVVPKLHRARRLEGVALHPDVAEVPVDLQQVLPQHPACLWDLVFRLAVAVQRVGLLVLRGRIEEREGHRAGLPLLHRLVHLRARGHVEGPPLADQRGGSVAKQVPEGAVEGGGQRVVAHEVHDVESRGEAWDRARGHGLLRLQPLLHEAPDKSLTLQVGRQEGHARAVPPEDKAHLHDPGEAFEQLLAARGPQLPCHLRDGRRLAGGDGVPAEQLDELLLEGLHLRPGFDDALRNEHHARCPAVGAPSRDDVPHAVHNVQQRRALLLLALGCIAALLHGQDGERAAGLQHDLQGQRVRAAAHKVPVLPRAHGVQDDVARHLAELAARAVEAERHGHEPRHVETEVLAVGHPDDRRGALRLGEPNRDRCCPGEVPGPGHDH
mmetsp:Transcript_81623/g.257421  ORF Transcript_81623/g.257421 Transcript_81623/m.257421 type:complete len:1086 (-) Transcript_81623:349-3606(-)